MILSVNSITHSSVLHFHLLSSKTPLGDTIVRIGDDWIGNWCHSLFLLLSLKPRWSSKCMETPLSFAQWTLLADQKNWTEKADVRNWHKGCHWRKFNQACQVFYCCIRLNIRCLNGDDLCQDGVIARLHFSVPISIYIYIFKMVYKNTIFSRFKET